MVQIWIIAALVVFLMVIMWFLNRTILSAALQQAIYSIPLKGLMLMRPRGLLGEVKYMTREDSFYSLEGGGERCSR